ncbi:MAG TPA: hypothetical protein VEK84_08860 [Terriglobales bacterium]|nr:hypothetical protein [Terriglobales bacterium]
MVSSFLWNWGRGVVFDAKFITSAVVGALGAAVTVQRNLSEIRAGYSKPARELANKKVEELLNMLAKVPPGESFSAWRQELELQITQSLRELDALRAKDSKLAEGSNHDLTLLQRLFVWFPPRDPRIWIVHALAYAFMAGGPLVIPMLILFGIGDAGSIGDVMVMFVFGSLAFRAWALAERKWAMESMKRADGPDQRIQAESGPLQALFVLRKARSGRMLVAQICMWTCLFCAAESLEDIFLSALDFSKAATQVEQTGKASLANGGSPEPKSQAREKAAKEARDDAKGGLLLLLTSLLGAGICRAWAAAEWLHASPPHPAFTNLIFPVPKLDTSKAWLLTASYVAAMAVLIVSVVKWSLIFKDSLDRGEFAFVSLAACIACNRLLSFLGYVANNSKENKSAALAQSTAG